MLKFFCNSVLFTMNIPVLHPYSEADRRRDELLKTKSKNAFRSGNPDEETAIDMPANQDDEELLAMVEESADAQREHVAAHEVGSPSQKGEKESQKEEERGEEEDGETEEHRKEDEEGEQKAHEEQRMKGEEGDKKEEEGDRKEEEEREQKAPAPAPPSL